MNNQSFIQITPPFSSFSSFPSPTVTEHYRNSIFYNEHNKVICNNSYIKFFTSFNLYLKQIRSRDQRLRDSQEAFKVKVFYHTVDNAITQLQRRFEGQKMVASLFTCLYPPNMSQLKLPKPEVAAEAKQQNIKVKILRKNLFLNSDHLSMNSEKKSRSDNPLSI